MEAVVDPIREPSSEPSTDRKPWYRVLYVQVIVAVLLGVMIGYFAPEYGRSLKPLGDGFIKLVKMMIAPIIFCTVVHGIASVGDLRKLGRVGIKSLVYFELVSTLALILGLIVVNVLRPGDGITPKGETYHASQEELDSSSKYGEKAKTMNEVEFVLNIIPTSFLGAFVSGELLQVLFVAILVAFALGSMGDRGKPILTLIEQLSSMFFVVMGAVVKLAPIGALGAMGYAVGAHGVGTLGRLAWLMAGFYLTSGVFVVFVLGGISAFLRFLRL